VSTTPWSTSADDALHAYLRLRPDTDPRDRIVLAFEFDSLICGGWKARDIAVAASSYASIGGVAPHFSQWAWKRRK